MPTYEYLCDNCGHDFEKFQSITARPLRKCPDCGKNQLKRLIGTGAGVIFRGSGFYETDYRSEGYKKAKEKETSPEKKEDKKKSDSKTETKSAKDSPKTDKKKSDKKS